MDKSFVEQENLDCSGARCFSVCRPDNVPEVPGSRGADKTASGTMG